jgi:uncharacterized protein (TIGR02001 family)
MQEGYYTNPRTLYYNQTSTDVSLRYDYFEYEVGLSYEFPLIEMSGTLYHTPDFFDSSGSSTNISYKAQVPIIKSLAIKGHVGYQWTTNSSQAGLPDYWNWRAGLTYAINKFGLNMEYTKSHLS